MEEAIELSRLKRDFTKGSLIKKIINHLIPLLLTSFLQLLFTTMDIFTVTKFGGGNNSSGAIGATSNLINLILCIFWGTTAGIGIVVGNAKGAKDYEKIKKTIGSSFILMFIASIAVMLFGIFASKSLLKLMGTSDSFIEKSTIYLTIYFIGAPFNLLYNTGASVLRSLGDTRRPLLAVIVSGIANICLNFLFVKKFDVQGVALATIISQFIAAIIVFMYLMFDKRLICNFELNYVKLYKNESLEIIKHGLMCGFQSFIFNFTNVFIQSCVNVLGEGAVIGKAAASQIEGYQYAILNGISQTCMVAVSQNFGAKNQERTKKSFIYCVILELTIVTVFDLLAFLLRKPLLSIFINANESTSADATKTAIESLIILGLPYAICGVAECCTAYLRGMKKPLVPTIVSLGCIVGVRMIFILFLFNIDRFHNATWLFLTYPFSWILCCLVYIPVLLAYKKKIIFS